MLGKWFERQVEKASDRIVAWAILAIFGLIGPKVLTATTPWFPAEALTKSGQLTLSSFSDWLFELISKDPVRAVVVVLAIVAAAALLIALALACQKILSVIYNAYLRRKLVQLVGLKGYWPDARPDIGHEAWSNLREELGQASPILNILGSTGIDTFGKQGSPLWDSVNGFRGEIKIILMSPESEFLGERARSVGMTEGAYREEIKTALEQIKKWQKAGRRVSHRTYDSPPNWKLILTSKLAWVQYYRHQKHVQQTPVYQFYATFGETGLYHVFDDEFARIWRLCGADSGAELGQRRDRAKK